jgi:SNF family Na+-dependent transporter
VLRKSPTINETGALVWPLVLALLISWIMCFLSLFRGVKLSGKIGYFTAIFPYFVLILLGVRGAFLDGAAIGIEYYIKPDLKKLLEFGVWKDAAGKKNTFIYLFSRELRLFNHFLYHYSSGIFHAKSNFRWSGRLKFVQ